VLYEYGACYQNSPTVTGTEAYMYCCIYLVECFCNMLFIMPHQMHHFANFQAPPSAVDFQWSCEQVYHKQEVPVCFLLCFLGHIVIWQYNHMIHWIKVDHVLYKWSWLIVADLSIDAWFGVRNLSELPINRIHLQLLFIHGLFINSPDQTVLSMVSKNIDSQGKLFNWCCSVLETKEIT